MKRIELVLNDGILKELQQIAKVKGISLEEAANKVLESYANRYSNMVNSTILAIERAKKRYD